MSSLGVSNRIMLALQFTFRISIIKRTTKLPQYRTAPSAAVHINLRHRNIVWAKQFGTLHDCNYRFQMLIVVWLMLD